MREQIKALTPQAKGKAKLAKTLADLDQQCAELEGATQRKFFGLPPSGKQPENFSTLNQHFAAILALADSADAAPTTQAVAADQELDESATALRKRWSVLREREILDLNGELKKAGLPTIDPKKSPAEELGGALIGDDEP